MKFTLLLLLFATPLLVLADEPSYSPLDAIQRFGSLSISDNSSFYAFSKDGSFRSGPLDVGGRGRELTGRWTADDSAFTVTANLFWSNGGCPAHDYRRIVFVIYPVHRRATEPKLAFGVPRELFDAYFLIDEMTKISEPTAPSK